MIICYLISQKRLLNIFKGELKLRHLNKSIKKVSILFIACVFFLVGCGSSSDSSKEMVNPEELEGETVKVLLSAGDVGQFNAWKARSEEFTEESGIEIDFIETPYENLLENITSDGIANGGSYDLVVFLDSMGPSVTQFLEPLDDYIERDDFDKERWPDSILELSTFENQLFSLPVRAHVQMMFYREDILNDLGLDVPETWEEFDEVTQNITEETDLYGVVPYYGAGNNGQNLFMWTSYLWSNGGDIFGEDYKPTFNNEEGIEATERYIDLLVKDQVAPDGSKTFGEQDSRTYFKQNKAAIWLGWWWVYEEFNDTESADKEVAGNVEYAPVPTWEGKDETSSNVSTFPIAMMKGSKNKDAAWEVLKWISDPELEHEMVSDTWNDEIPSDQNNTVVTQIENLEDEKLNELSDDFYKVGLQGFENAQTLPQIPEWPQIADIISSSISKMSTGAEVEENLNDAAKQVEKVLDDAGYYD